MKIALNRGNIRIIVDRSSAYAEEFAAYLKNEGYAADVEAAGRHTNGRHTCETAEPLEDFYESEEDFLNRLWVDFCNS